MVIWRDANTIGHSCTAEIGNYSQFGQIYNGDRSTILKNGRKMTVWAEVNARHRTIDSHGGS